MEYGFIENSMGLQEGYDPTSLYSGAFDSEFIHVSQLIVCSLHCLDLNFNASCCNHMTVLVLRQNAN